MGVEIIEKIKWNCYRMVDVFCLILEKCVDLCVVYGSSENCGGLVVFFYKICIIVWSEYIKVDKFYWILRNIVYEKIEEWERIG